MLCTRVCLVVVQQISPSCLQVSVGVGTLAGSTIMLLSIAWGGSLIAGRCDLSERVSANTFSL